MLHAEFCSELVAVSRGLDDMGLPIKCARLRLCATSLLTQFTLLRFTLMVKTLNFVIKNIKVGHARLSDNISSYKCT